MRTILAVLAVLLTARPIAAQPSQNPLAYVQFGQWANAQETARADGPVAEKLIVWLRMLTPNAARAAEIGAFIRQNPDWPQPAVIERRRQDAIAGEPDDAVAAAECTATKPVPTPGADSPLGRALYRCADALANLGRGEQAGALAREAWVTAISDPGTEAAFVHRFRGLIAPADQWARFQRLAWNDAAGAQRQIAYLAGTQAVRAAARLGLKANFTGYTVVPAEEPSAFLDLARAYRKLDQDTAATALWRASGAAAQRAAPDHLAEFWSERQQLARKLLLSGNPADAYAVVSGHGQTDPANVAEAEFLAGFIALRRLNDPRAAAAHFTALAAASPAVLTQSRAYYWLGQAKAAEGGDGKTYYTHAAEWPMTFYGQLAARAAGMTDAALVRGLRAAPAVSPGLAGTRSTAELATAASLLVSWGDPRRARAFLLRMDEIARTPGERIAVGDYAAGMGLPDVTVLIARRLGRDGIVPPPQGWPMPYEPPSVLDPAVSLAIMRQESNFDAGIVSASGARGLMQLMPATAQTVSRRLGEPTSTFLLTTDPGHNMRMGTAYLQEVLEQFDNSIPLAAAAYNAGPRRVAQWLHDNGDPRTESIGMIDWIETIPYNETRNYVQRVLENIVVYQARRSGTLPAAMAQWSR